MLKHNQTRMQQKPYCREERFLSSEKSTLGELPKERFELKSYAELKVGDNGHIYLQRNKHYYSVPFAYIGTKVKIIYTRNMLSITRRFQGQFFSFVYLAKQSKQYLEVDFFDDTKGLIGYPDRCTVFFSIAYGLYYYID